MKPAVSLGLPVYNGENYVRLALDSILQQTFEDFELIISDNASTDSTPEVLYEYANKDSRILLHKQKTNIGASSNFMTCLQHSRGKYFKWAAHDDYLLPTYLEKLSSALEAHPECPLAYSDVRIINQDNETKQLLSVETRYEARSPTARFKSLAKQTKGCPYEFFGLIRRDVLNATHGMRAEFAADFLLLYELLLQGPFVHVKEPLLVARHHPSQSMAQNLSSAEWVAWFDPSRKGQFKSPYFQSMRETWRLIRKAPISWHQKVGCFSHYLQPKQLIRDVRHLIKDYRNLKQAQKETQ